jgi:branched-chain amino acid transport system permease protein
MVGDREAKMKSIKLTTGTKTILLGIFTAALFIVPFIIKDTYILHVIISCFIYSCLALSLNLIIGLTGQFSLGHVTFYGMGAYITALLMMKASMSFWLTILISAAGVGIFGYLLALPALNLRGDYLAVVTLGFGEVFRLFLVNAIDITRGPMGIPGIPSPKIGSFVINTKQEYYFLALIILIAVVIFVRRLIISGFGLSMLCVKEDDVAASAIGIYPRKYKLWAFVIGAVIAGIMGSFYAVYMSFISPSSFQYGESITMVSMVILGGMGSIAGPILGACILTVLPEALRSFSEYRMIIYGAALVIMMIFKPNGIWGLDKRVRNIYMLQAGRGVKNGKSASGIQCDNSLRRADSGR